MSALRLILVISLILMWGYNLVIIKVGLNGMPPIFLAFARFFLASVPFIFFFKKPNAPFSRIALYSLVTFTTQFALFFLGMNFGVSPGLASLIIQLHTFFSLLLAHFIFHEKIKARQIFGAIASFSGIIYAGMHFEGALCLTGFFLIVAAAIAWGAGNAISKTLGNINMISLVVWASMLAWPPLLLLSLLIEGPAKILFSLQNLTWTSFGSILYLSYLATLFGYGVWSWLLHQMPLSKVAPFTLLIPIIAMLSSALFLGESIQPWKIAAGLLVIGGLCINFLGPRLFPKKQKATST